MKPTKEELAYCNSRNKFVEAVRIECEKLSFNANIHLRYKYAGISYPKIILNVISDRLKVVILTELIEFNDIDPGGLVLLFKMQLEPFGELGMNLSTEKLSRDREAMERINVAYIINEMVRPLIDVLCNTYRPMS